VESVNVNGVELEYEAIGSGEPVLLISPVLADGFLPLLSEPALADRYRLIRYHKRGWAGSTHTPPPVSVSDHAADAAALLDHLGVHRAHIAGHSSGAAVAAQLALDRPDVVHTLILLELSLLSVPSGEAFLEHAGPAFEAYASGDHSGALAMFMTGVSGLDWATCRALLDERVPGAVAQAVEDADTFFGVELPALTEWEFGPAHAAAIGQPVLSVLGSETERLWVEVAEFLRASLRQVEELKVDGLGHLLHIQRSEPVARGMAEFLERNAIRGTSRSNGRTMNAISRADAPVAIEGDGVELRMQELGGGMSTAFVRVPKGGDFRPALAGLPDDLCQCPHWGYLLRGRLKMHTRNGADVYEAGQAFYWAPGHAPEALEDSEYVDFSPTDEFNHVVDHIRGQS
jgi:pimeloyl-ACP methyl ester carboxylesterase